MGNIYLGAVLVFFIGAFAVKNIKTYFDTGASIRGRSVKLTSSIVLSTLIYVLLLLRLSFLDAASLYEMESFHIGFVRQLGFVLVTIGFCLGLAALITMKKSWRVGIKYDQKTELITHGIFSKSRNPYFLSYDILILGFILIFPSPVLMVLYISLVWVFHYMILEEESYLKSTHGSEYEDYQMKVNRYWTWS